MKVLLIIFVIIGIGILLLSVLMVVAYILIGSEDDVIDYRYGKPDKYL